VFGLASKAAHKNESAEAVLCQTACETHITQLLLALFLPNGEQITFYVAGQPFSKLLASSGSGSQ
jgi:hypothetical protein